MLTKLLANRVTRLSLFFILCLIALPLGITIAYAQSPELSWNTFLGGGSGDDYGYGIALDGSGNVYVAGYSTATWGTPVQPFGGNSDAYVAKLDSSGNLIWNTFVGGDGWDLCFDIAVDGSGNVYICGRSDATWGTPVQAYTDHKDAFAAKLDSSGSLIWNTFMGGDGWNEQGEDIAVDGNGNVYVAGWSDATWGSPVQAYTGGNDAWAVRLDSSGNLDWNTFLGSGGNDIGQAITVGGSGNVYVTGWSSATWGTPVQAYTLNSDAYVAKLNSSSGLLTWNTFVGGAGNEYGYGIVIDGSGNIYVAGGGDATWGSPVRAYTAGNDAFAARLNSSGSLVWNTFLGGSGWERGYGIAVDGSSGNVYICGRSDATWGSPVRAYTAGNDAFSTGLDSSGNLAWNTFLGGDGEDYGEAIALDGSGNVYVAGWSDVTWGSPVRPYSSSLPIDAFAAKISLPTVTTTGGSHILLYKDLDEGASTGDLPVQHTPPNLRPKNLSVSHASVNVNQPVTVSAEVVNEGELGGETNIALRINGFTEQVESVYLPAGASKTVTFTVEKSEPGTYKIDVGNQQTSFVVLPESNEVAATNSASMLPMALISVLFVLVLGLVIVVIRRRSA